MLTKQEAILALTQGASLHTAFVDGAKTWWLENPFGEIDNAAAIEIFQELALEESGDNLFGLAGNSQSWRLKRISLEVFNVILGHLRTDGWADSDIAWAEGCSAPTDADDFALEAAFVICNSGMKNAIAQKIFDRVREALLASQPITEKVFGHKGKAAAIQTIWDSRVALLKGYLDAEDKLEFCGALPWIGPITKYHLAKNFGADVAKPDVHLKRLADREGTTSQGLCERLGKATGYRAATIDLLLWRACAYGILDSKTGAIRA